MLWAAAAPAVARASAADAGVQTLGGHVGRRISAVRHLGLAYHSAPEASGGIVTAERSRSPPARELVCGGTRRRARTTPALMVLTMKHDRMSNGTNVGQTFRSSNFRAKHSYECEKLFSRTTSRLCRPVNLKRTQILNGFGRRTASFAASSEQSVGDGVCPAFDFEPVQLL